jgi:hypothetical protein
MPFSVVRILSILSVLILFGCGQKKQEGTLSEDQLVAILIDAHTAEAALSYLYGEKKDTFAENYYQEIYTIHDISETEFRRAIRNLRNDNAAMIRVYSRILEQLDEKIPD